MKTTTKNTAGIKVRANVKGGGLLQSNHVRGGMKVRAGLKAGGSLHQNHNAIVLA